MSPQYLYATSKAYWLLAKLRVKKFPLDIIAIINEYENVSVLSYSELSKASNMNFSNMVHFLGSNKGACVKKLHNFTFVIFYNDTKGEGFSRFTIAHELGHIILNHHSKYDLLSMNKKSATYKRLEKEADCFARNLLSPVFAAFDKTGCMKSSKLEKQFLISEKAAETRYSLYETDRSNYLDIGYKLEDERIKCVLLTDNRKRCTNCGSYENLKSYNHCIICGEKTYKIKPYKVELRMKYEGIDESKCPKCNNEDIIYSLHNFCFICGTRLQNQCDNCEIDLDSSARYCYNCGEQSTFFSKRFLKPYDYKEIEIKRLEPVEEDALPF